MELHSSVEDETMLLSQEEEDFFKSLHSKPAKELRGSVMDKAAIEVRRIEKKTK